MSGYGHLENNLKRVRNGIRMLYATADYLEFIAIRRIRQEIAGIELFLCLKSRKNIYRELSPVFLTGIDREYAGFG